MGCAIPRDITHDTNLKKLLDSLETENAQITKQQKETETAGIRRLWLHKTKDGPLVSMDLLDARLEAVFLRLMAATHTTYSLNDVALTGRVTAKVSRLPLLKALKAILSTQGVYARMEGDALVLHYRSNVSKPPEPPGAPAIPGMPGPQPMESYESYHLKYLDPDAAWTLLDGLFPPGPMGRLVTFGKQPERNGIFLAGTGVGVRQAIQVLSRADRPQPTVLLEALVIEFDSDAFEQMSSNLKNLQRRTIGPLTTAIGDPGSAALVFTQTPGVSNPQVYTAIINMLMSNDKARLISRPFVSTLSGRPALIDVSGSRYVVVQQVQGGGASVVGTQPINSGVTMNITPTVVAENMIRVSLDIQDSQFVPTSGNIAVEVNKHSAKSMVQVRDGQTIIIGGMTLKRRTSSNAGLPLLRHIPLLNLIFASQSQTQRNQEVAMYITPHIVEPGMETRMLNKDAFAIPHKWKEQSLTPWEKLP